MIYDLIVNRLSSMCFLTFTTPNNFYILFFVDINISLVIQALYLSFTLNFYFPLRLLILKILPLNFSCIYFNCQHIVLFNSTLFFSLHLITFLVTDLVQNTKDSIFSLFNRKSMKLMNFPTLPHPFPNHL